VIAALEVDIGGLKDVLKGEWWLPPCQTDAGTMRPQKKPPPLAMVKGLIGRVLDREPLIENNDILAFVDAASVSRFFVRAWTFLAPLYPAFS
jgi:hypothetical protein